tara:strand:+ start:10581 stop:10850 length:270 start_codon:yes stop_codon:yes gene_type:complete
MPTIDGILEERGPVHGDAKKQFTLSQNLKAVARYGTDFEHLSPLQKEALDMILMKVSRVVVGDENHQDHWDDIAGYAALVSKELKNEKA